MIELVRERRAIYIKKRDESDPLGDDNCNRYERMQHTVEALDLLLEEIAALTPVSEPIRLKLDKRIHNQRRALRENWLIVEQRGWYRQVHRDNRYLHTTLRLYAENNDLKRQLAALAPAADGEPM